MEREVAWTTIKSTLDMALARGVITTIEHADAVVTSLATMQDALKEDELLRDRLSRLEAQLISMKESNNGDTGSPDKD